MSGTSQVRVDQRRIYVLCPAHLVTGGPELLHQLVSALRAQGRQAFICYVPLGQPAETPEPYVRYSCPVSTEVPDEPDVAVVVPEVFTRALYAYRRAQHVIWWLSVDYYRGVLGTPAWKMILRRFITSDIPDPARTTHLCQSAYALDFVTRRFHVDGVVLSDYLASDFLEPTPERPRRDAVAFNPSKGYAFTRRLMKANPGVEFVPLKGMTRTEMRTALDTCKMYIDFGRHPGRDRIPREAAMRGAVVVVGRRGSARFYEDVPLDGCYKIEPDRHAVREVGSLMRKIFEDFPAHHVAQQGYRDAILGQQALFHERVRSIFGEG